jgi:hypothetical protein
MSNTTNISYNAGGMSNMITTSVLLNDFTISAAGDITFSTSKRRCIETKKDDIKIVIKSQGDGPAIQATLDPEVNLHPIELLRIMMLVQLIESGEPMGDLDPIAYLRRYDLERHFRFTSE